ncbi:hypothetical protein FHR81_003179 [Actinoalloteichus hoggarensis]|uniref:Uncharacterized protein n=1 Tax=Actinoalloteichus hoggarensis TaxID=1470176 RepID=A0A221W7B7_9PSEU|nr:hypothetical protein [Actinoalloteichus hoggarensis]ASO21536.1 hypothetical protein AHOG_19570 [Actinoalloteichus hoggarensis]MBB5922127.1 hypothetical protein [Actinoalloteichus hoggarensis]
MRNIPVNLSGYKLMITEEPQMKMRTDDQTGVESVATDFEGNTQFVVKLFMKQRPSESGQRVPKGEEFAVTLRSDPGDGFEEGTYVQLIDATVSPWQTQRGNRFMSGISFSAMGLRPID